MKNVISCPGMCFQKNQYHHSKGRTTSKLWCRSEYNLNRLIMMCHHWFAFLATKYISDLKTLKEETGRCLWVKWIPQYRSQEWLNPCNIYPSCHALIFHNILYMRLFTRSCLSDDLIVQATSILVRLAWDLNPCASWWNPNSGWNRPSLKKIKINFSKQQMNHLNTRITSIQLESDSWKLQVKFMLAKRNKQQLFPNCRSLLSPKKLMKSQSFLLPC